MPGQPSTLEAADEAATPIRRLLEDVWATLDNAVEGEGRWLELYQGVPADPVFVCVDAMGNVLHAEFNDANALTVSYLPGWCYEAATAAHADRWPDPPAVLVTDLKTAVPLVFELTVKHSIAGADRTVTVAGQTVAYRPLPFGYLYTPARGFTIEESNPRSTPLVHWSAMRLRLAMAPGVAYTTRPLLSDNALKALRAAYIPGDGPITCDQTLALEVERHRHPGTLPPLGGPLRSVPAAEPDLAAGAVVMSAAVDGGAGLDSGPGLDGGGLLPAAVQQTRPDGVDLLLMKPDQWQPPRGQPWAWQPDWFVAAASTVDDAMWSLVKDIYDTYVEWLGGLPDTAPLPIRIRVDPASAEDRFAYRLDHLDGDRNPTAIPVPATADEPAFRLTVVHTAGVQVFLDKAIAAAGVTALDGIVEYRAQVVGHPDDVPLEIADDLVVPRATLPDRAATLEEMLHVVATVGQFIPVPTLQAMYDLRDLGSVAAYVLTGKDLYGQPMSGLAAAITLGGVLLPQVVERVGGALLGAGRRVLTLGDTPLPRLRAAAAAVEPADVNVAAALLESLPKELR